MRRKLIILSLIVFVLVFSITYAATTSFAYKDLLYDPRAMGMAGAMTALADSPTSAIYNPALMGEYSRIAIKLGMGAAPLDETNLNNLKTITDYLKILQNGQEPPNGNLYATISPAGYLHLGISKLGFTLFGDGDFYFDYYKYKSDDPYQDLQVEGNISIKANAGINGAVTIAIPAFDLLGFKVNLGANVRLRNDFYLEQSVSVKATQSGVLESETTNVPNDNNYYNSNFTNLEQRYLSIDLGAYVRFTPFLAAGLVVKDAYSVPFEGKYTQKNEYGYFNSDKEIVTYTSSEETGSMDIELPPMSLKAGVFVKIPVLATRISVDADLDKNLTPLSYRIGVEQPLAFLVVRGGTLLNTDFQPQYYTLGAGINILLLQADTALVLNAQNMEPIAGSISGSIKF